MRWKPLHVICILGLLLLSGCSNTYERDVRPGEIKTITLDEMTTMMTQGKTYTIMLTTTMCGYCQEFETMLEGYLMNHKVTVYNVVLDKEPRSQAENLDIIYRYFDDFSTTPGVFYVEGGEVEAHLKGDDGGLDETRFDSWVMKYQMDKQ